MRTSQTLALAAVTAAATAQDITKASCVDGLYMLVARGTNEPVGSGVTGLIAERIAERIKDSKVQALDYPASFTDPAYADSVADGSKQVGEVIADYAERCPGKKIAVFGYSQGAQVTTNALCGGADGAFKSDLKPVDQKVVEDNVIAVTLYGDPTHVNGVNYNMGTSKKSGIFGRENTTVCTKNYSDIFRSYCDTGDVYCDSGNKPDVHGDYVERYGADTVEFVLKQWNKATGGDVSTDGGKPFVLPDESSSATVSAPMSTTPMATPSQTGEDSTLTRTKPTETSGSSNGGSGAGEGGSEGDNGSGAAGLTAVKGMLVGAPLVLAFWNLL